jgi:hypothetical protein
MHRKLVALAVTVAAALGTLAMGLAGTAAADAGSFQVDTGGPSLNVRDDPSLNGRVVSSVPNGADIVIACQTYGDPVTSPWNGFTSNVWDKLGGNATGAVYVSDLYVDTPGAGYISLVPCNLP